MEFLSADSAWINLSFWANLGSLAGFIITVIVFLRLRYVRRDYLLLTRGQAQINRLRELTSEINRYPDLPESDLKLVLGKCRSTLKGLGRKVKWSTWLEIRRLRSEIRGAEREISEENIESVFADLHRLMLELDDIIQDKKWEISS